jgi:uncharacterized protein
MTKRRADFSSHYGPWAMVTGAAEGLGAEFARQIAHHGINLILVDRQSKRLEQTAKNLVSHSHVEARPMHLDLSKPGWFEELTRATEGLEIGLLIANAAHSAIGKFLEQSLEDHLLALEVNCRSTLKLVYRLGQEMRARRRGGIVLMSSLSALQGSPLVTCYAATKAFNLLLAEGLWDELSGEGVDVVASCPGVTRTPGYLASNPVRGRWLSAPEMEPTEVVEQTLDALGRTPCVIPGRANRLAAFVTNRLLSRPLAIKTLGRALRGMYPGRPRTK